MRDIKTDKNLSFIFKTIFLQGKCDGKKRVFALVSDLVLTVFIVFFF